MDIIGFIFIIIGLIFDILGCIGIIRMPDVYLRLQTATKGVTLGTCSILFGVFLISGFNTLGIKCLLCIVILFLISPVIAHALARASYKKGIPLCRNSVIDEYGEKSGKEES